MTAVYNEFSAGFIVFRETKSREYLLLHHGSDYWNFPKGKLESGESELDAAKRELTEETGLKDIKYKNGFEGTFDYVYNHGNRRIKKVVKMFLAQYLEGNIILSHEHLDYAWLSYDKALKNLNFSNTRRILAEAEKFLSMNQI